jgi:hypothetical protein
VSDEYTEEMKPVFIARIFDKVMPWLIVREDTRREAAVTFFEALDKGVIYPGDTFIIEVGEPHKKMITKYRVLVLENNLKEIEAIGI